MVHALRIDLSEQEQEQPAASSCLHGGWSALTQGWGAWRLCSYAIVCTR